MTSPHPGMEPRARSSLCRRTAALALGLLAVSGLAQTPEASSPNSADVDTHPELQWGARDQFDRVRFMNGFSTHLLISKEPPKPPSILFFPPIPPILESDIPVITPLEPGPQAPEELSAFVGELFYPLLATRLQANDLPKEIRGEILDYRDSKMALQGELRALIVALKDTDPAERARHLAELASRQADRIAALGDRAENIRSDLRERNVLGVAVDEHSMKEDKRLWVHSVAETPSDAVGLAAESEALMDAAFYQEGLGAEQRRLLFESSIEMRTEAVTPAGTTKADTRVLSFSPETARIRIPKDLGPEMEHKVAAYIDAKNALKSELRNALRDNADAIAGARAEALQRTCDAQAARIGDLQAKAEEIRAGLTQLPNPPGPPVPMALPQDLAARIAAYRAHKVELLKTLRAMLASPTPAASQGPRGPQAKAEDPVSGALAWLHDGTTTTEIEPANLRISQAEFHRMQGELIEEINREEAGIRVSLADYVRESKGPSDRKSINDLLRDFEDARQREEAWESYRDYQAAVLMPGLSAAQRQLLFDAGVVELNLPLPTGEKVH
jgi:hypothetical protein